jgi:hypothetical protein
VYIGLVELVYMGISVSVVEWVSLRVFKVVFWVVFEVIIIKIKKRSLSRFTFQFLCSCLWRVFKEVLKQKKETL